MKKTLRGLLFAEKNASSLQMSMTLMLVLNLILSNILVVKPINLFGIQALPNTLAMITFPITYILSDVFQEVYGYKWSRITATWAFIGSALAAIMFALMIAVNGNQNWDMQSQDALVRILGNTPIITMASLLAFWVGDLSNDLVFRAIKKKTHSHKTFFVRSIGSSIVGKYVDAIVFTFIGLHFLPMQAKIMMVLTAPFVQVVLEAVLFPITSLVAKKLKKVESITSPVID